MKRIIKFRGKDLKTDKWLYGSLVFDCDKKPMIFVSGYSHTGLGFSGASYVDPDTVGQFTGLCDKNGKEIYEGDIVDMKSITPRHWVVKFSWGTFYLAGIESKFPCHKCFSQYEYEICYEYSFIGNIHDNPDLMKGGEE